jgi:tetrahydromethanopterin S-methyltransferase subunit B
MRIKRKKVKMCPEQLEKGYCHIVTDKHTTKVCPYAHNPIELDLIPVETKMKNLNGVIMSQTIKMKNMKPLEPWKPSKAG